MLMYCDSVQCVCDAKGMEGKIDVDEDAKCQNNKYYQMLEEGKDFTPFH